MRSRTASRDFGVIVQAAPVAHGTHDAVVAAGVVRVNALAAAGHVLRGRTCAMSKNRVRFQGSGGLGVGPRDAVDCAGVGTATAGGLCNTFTRNSQLM